MGGGDGVMASIGTGAVSLGDSFMSFGTSAWVSTVAKGPMFDPERRNTNYPHIVKGLYLNDGVMQCAGQSYAWSKQALGEEAWNVMRSADGAISELIAKSPTGANGVLFLPYLLGERCPWWNPDAKGSFLGLRMETSKADLLRAVMEGVAYNMAYITDLLRSNGSSLKEITAVGGGVRGGVWRQILADAMDAEIRIPDLLESATSFGAAITGGLGVGVFTDVKRAAESFVKIREVCHPDPERAAFYRKRRELFVQCYRAMEPYYQAL